MWSFVSDYNEIFEPNLAQHKNRQPSWQNVQTSLIILDDGAAILNFEKCLYRVGQKKLHTELMAITLSILNGFSKFFHCWKAK